MSTDLSLRRRLALILPALVGACDRPRADPLEYGSGADVAAILRANGVSAPSLDCRNPKLHGRVIRAVSCTLRLAPADVAALSANLPLAPGAPEHSPPDHADSCEATAGLASTSPGVEVLVGDNTKVPNGASRVALHLDRATGAACIELEYPWSS